MSFFFFSFYYTIIKKDVFYEQATNSTLKCYFNIGINHKLDEIKERKAIRPPLINAVREVNNGLFNWNSEVCVCVRN